MPLVRVEVRNEYALGAPELYREAKKEDPKEILEGVAVSGLVGVLRQLGDLAEFAAEVFHGLQEEVTITSSRSHKLMARVQRIEAALSPLEKALLAQRSHLHFAYTAGSNWHARIRSEQNHFVYSDVPQFIMESYENCRDPPCLQLLDRFDSGGPGSCLKRYSDPTFFKRSSVASGEASTDKISRDKKGRKIKKRRSFPKNGEVSRDTSAYNSGRMRFGHLNIGVHSPSQTASTYDATLRSDFGEQSNLHLRNGSGFTDGDSRTSYSVQPEEQDSRESISSLAKRRSDFLDYNFVDEQITNAYDDIEINLSEEQAGCIPSSVTWDEKREALDPTRRVSGNNGIKLEDDHNTHLESFSQDLDSEILCDDAVNFVTVDKMDLPSYDHAVESGDVHIDEIESETDHFMDALNTIESEFETEIDCTKKQEVEDYHKLDDKGVDDELIRHNIECQSSNSEPNVLSNPIESECEADIDCTERVVDAENELGRHNMECLSSNSESNVLSNSSLVNGSGAHNLVSTTPKPLDATTSSINGVAAKDEIKAISLAEKDLQSSQQAGDSSSPVSPQHLDSGNNVVSTSWTASANFRDSRPGMPVTDRATNSAESQKQLPETSNAASFTFWTNGGLLGLQPSKPPDFGVSKALPQDQMHKEDAAKQGQMENLKGITDHDDMDSSTCHDYQERGASFRKTSWKISPADLDIKHGKYGDLQYHNNANSTGSSVTTASGSFVPVNSTGSNKKLLTGGSGNYYPTVDHQNANAFEQKINRNGTFSGRSKDPFIGDSPVLSPSSSPPLKHMKISFQPIGGFETTKLKLKFPDVNTNSGNGSDIFPSFQLVPEASFTPQEVGSDSDADTFYRSSPSLSDDCHSNQSESNSDQWESSESPTSKDRDIYDSFRRVSLTESVSAVQEKGRTNRELQLPFTENGAQNSESCGSSDAQSLSTVNNSIRKELRNDTNLNDLVEPLFVPSPAPPPLPPVQWRGSSAPLDGSEDKPESSYYASFDRTHSSSTISQPKPAPLNEDQIDTANTQKLKQSSSWKSNKQREANQSTNVDENDFLRQIRTKSFNLRRTVTAKPTVPSGSSATVQVTAILQKANAIRQAVGSDGEEDGNWSDS
ncbi:hypothetical protein ABFS82_08G135900 [Erythranthe guttata]|uniref:Protein SCAR n=1 Tax=Erythranthe guttata TaxID=4155 RepID=A0A022RS48_ERYGU|nr:PREDICTED: protein SCAR3-like isoform X1 [Erythranthe guttata]XP_012830296.1 PREDICTED: protein SCAR3-like isoform X1 [Erythranthe guttata]EYU43332.1 hypothetical protein MIMGU_mgv1a000504mg [Erythranthe guttata]|eukprot:XP_012830295.1 PREDICTED: protein SCAR3-like isoform X1 [Erythranthe guttata]